MAAVRFPKPEVILSQPWIKTLTFGMQIDICLFKRMQSLNLNLRDDSMAAVLKIDMTSQLHRSSSDYYEIS